jgi:uncharacterized membrane protein YjjB (DUF3815 family)
VSVPEVQSPTEPPNLDEHEHEDALEPRHLIRRSDVILRAGIMMLGAGTSGLRVREVMQAVARTVGIREILAQVTFTDIVLTVKRRGTFRTQVAEIPAPGVNAHRIALLMDLAHSLPERATVAEVDTMLDDVAQQRPLYPTWLLTGLQLNHLAVVMTSAATATGLYLVFTRLLDLAFGAPSPRMAAGLICAAIFLIPGFPLITAGLDLTRIDLLAGVPRMAYAAMVLLAITIGVWVMVTLSGVSPDTVPTLEGPVAIVWLALLASSFFAVFGWATMFNSPLKMAVASGVAALIGNVPRLLLLQAGVKPPVATFVGCFLMGLLCALAAQLFSLEKIIMTVPTILVSIPGSAALRTLIYFDQADVLQAMQNGVQTVLAVIAMVAGLSGARMLTDPEWAFTRTDPPGTAWHLVGRMFGRGRRS